MSRSGRTVQTEPKPEPSRQDPRRSALIRLLSRRGVPGKEEILRVKSLIRELAADGDAAQQPRADEFISAYFDVYLARVTGDEAVERSALRKCLECLGTGAEATSHPSGDVPDRECPGREGGMVS